MREWHDLTHSNHRWKGGGQYPLGDLYTYFIIIVMLPLDSKYKYIPPRGAKDPARVLCGGVYRRVCGGTSYGQD